MPYDALPATGSWRHHGAREGFEVLRVTHHDGGVVLEGRTAALEDGASWAVGYRLEVAADWSTSRAEVDAFSASGDHRVLLERDGDRWTVDGHRRPDLDGCLDVDLESSAVTNTLPVHRLAPAPGVRVDAPAAFVRVDGLGVDGLGVERLEQTYAGRDPRGASYDYTCARFGVACVLTYDAAGLVVDYPGLAVRRS